MNREIKFRAWDERRSKWVDEFDLTHNGSPFIINMFETTESLEVRLMQYTGLKDKKGKDIYEGDILFNNNTESKCHVVFRNGTFCGKRINDITPNDVYPSTLRYFEIVGNIHENPQLL